MMARLCLAQFGIPTGTRQWWGMVGEGMGQGFVGPENILGLQDPLARILGLAQLEGLVWVGAGRWGP